MNVVRRADLGDRAISQKPELASSFVNIWAHASWASVWSTTGSGCLSLCLFSFKRVRSTQMRTWFIPPYHSVGSVTGVITPSSSIWLSSSLSHLRSGTATLQGVDNAYGFANSCIRMV